MTDEEVDADIERMLQQHRARKALGWSYFQASGHRGPTKTDDSKVRRQNTARQQAYRARKLR